jgi:hypothetical protein
MSIEEVDATQVLPTLNHDLQRAVPNRPRPSRRSGTEE